MNRKPFGDLTKKAIEGLTQAMIDTAVAYTDALNTRGLSSAGSFSVYRAVTDAIHAEWEKARASLRIRRGR